MNNNVNLYCTTRGSGPPLILIMGLGAEGAVWEEHVKAYEKHFTCYLIDNRGVGDSPKPTGPYSTQDMADDIARLMDRLGVGAAQVAGISMGGTIAQWLAIMHPEKVKSLVVVSSWACCSPYMKMVFQHFKKMRAMSRLEDFMQLLQLWIWSADYTASHSGELAEAREAVTTLESPQPQQGFEGQCDACITHDALDRLGEISVPCLITVGDQDIFTPRACAELLRERIGHSTLEVFEGRAHAHHWEDLQRFNTLTTGFLLEQETEHGRLSYDD